MPANPYLVRLDARLKKRDSDKNKLHIETGDEVYVRGRFLHMKDKDRRYYGTVRSIDDVNMTAYIYFNDLGEERFVQVYQVCHVN